MKPIVSVLMSVFNSEEFLEDSINSILNQTFKEFEFLIINDGSTDKSEDIIKKFMKFDKRIRYIKQNNIGLTKSLNKGIKIAEGTLIARQDADDISNYNRLETQIKVFENRHVDLCCSRTWLIEQKRKSPRLTYYLPKSLILLIKNPFIHGTFLIKKNSLDELGGYDENFYYSQDYKLICDFFIKKYKIVYLNDVLYRSRLNTNGISFLRREEQKLYANNARNFYRSRYFKMLKLYNRG